MRESKNIKIEKGNRSLIDFSKEGLMPELWTPDEPNLYELEVQWTNKKGQLLDAYQCQVGYRTVQTKGKDILLNGQKYWLRGANMPPYGYKPNDEKTARGFLQLMHDGNTVITRTHGNPWNDMWFTAADEIGIGVSCEGVRPWALMTKAPPPNKALLAHWKEEQLETVKKYRNHPSILFYSISNEGLQGDYENPEKLAIFKDIMDAVSAIDSSRPIFQTSGDPDVKMQADIEDVHSYWGWYDQSSFVNDYTKPRRGLNSTNGRPFVNEECAVPYSMIDNGAVHPAYVGRYSAQSWIGDIGVYGKNVSYFQEHIYQEAKRKAELLRHSRKFVDNAGFMLFSNVTWIQHALSRQVMEWKPFPVYYGVRESFQPVLIAMTSPQRNFFAGDTLHTAVFIVNDDTGFRDIKNTFASIQLIDEHQKILAEQKLQIGNVDYYDVKEVATNFSLPEIKTDRQQAEVRLILSDVSGVMLSKNSYAVELYKRATGATDGGRSILSVGNSHAVNKVLAASGKLYISNADVSKVDVIVIGPFALATDSAVMVNKLNAGGRLILLEQKGSAHKYCNDVIVPDFGAVGDDMKDNDSYMFTNSNIFKNGLEQSKGEFVEMLGWKDSLPLFKGLDAMDWKWWAMKDSSAAYVSSASHKVDVNNDSVTPIGRYLNSHFYWQGNLKKVYDATISYPVFEVDRKYGQLVVCELNITESVNTDPRAALTLTNLVTQPIGKASNK